MKNIFLILLVCAVQLTYAQTNVPNDEQRKAIHALIDKYSLAREKQDTVLLKNILTSDIDQLVSNGEWRTGIREAIRGMLSSSASAPGTRTLTIEKIKLFNATSGIVDCRYEIQNTDRSIRKMWSSFLVVMDS